MQKINKISKKTVVLISIFIGLSYYTNGQISCPTTTNTDCSLTDYLGWDASVGRTLDIKNNGNYSIDFYTNTNARMQIRSNGKVGIGNFGAPPLWRKCPLVPRLVAAQVDTCAIEV